MPEYVKKECIAIVRGHGQRLHDYQEERYRIINASPSSRIEAYMGYIYDAKTKKEKEVRYAVPRSNTNAIANPTHDKVEALERLDNSRCAQKIRAVDNALYMIASQYGEGDVRKKMCDTLMESVVLGKRFVFRHYDVPVSKATFYRRRDEFLYYIGIYADCF